MASQLRVISEVYEDGVHINLCSFTVKQPIAASETSYYTVTITVGYNSESVTYILADDAHREYKRLVEMPKSFLLLQYSHILVDN